MALQIFFVILHGKRNDGTPDIIGLFLRLADI